MDSPAAERLRRMRDFYAYMLAELPALIQRWHETQPPAPEEREQERRDAGHREQP